MIPSQASQVLSVASTCMINEGRFFGGELIPCFPLVGTLYVSINFMLDEWRNEENTISTFTTLNLCSAYYKLNRPRDRKIYIIAIDPSTRTSNLHTYQGRARRW